MMPGIPALVGIAPSPPDKPVFGYGAEPGPFGEVLKSILTRYLTM